MNKENLNESFRLNPLPPKNVMYRALLNKDNSYEGIFVVAVKKRKLRVFYSNNIKKTQKKVTDAGEKIIKLVFSFPGGNELAVWFDKQTK